MVATPATERLAAVQKDGEILSLKYKKRSSGMQWKERSKLEKKQSVLLPDEASASHNATTVVNASQRLELTHIDGGVQG